MVIWRDGIPSVPDPGLSVPSSVTPGRIRFTIDPTNGDDAAPFGVTTETLESAFGPGTLDVNTFIATTKTLQGTVNRLHGVFLKHPVFINLPTGVILCDGLGVNGGRPELSIGGFTIGEDWKFLDEVNFIYDAPPGLYFQGSKDIKEDTRIADVFGAAQIGDTTLAMTVDEYRGAVIEIYEGTGADQWRRCIRNTATTFQLLTSWGTTPDGTSRFRVWYAGSIIQGGDISIADVMNSYNFVGVNFAPTVKLNFTGFEGLVARNAAIWIAGEVEGDAPGTTKKTILAHASSSLAGYYPDFGSDPLLSKQPGPYLKNGWFHLVNSYMVSMNVVVDAGAIEVRERSGMVAVVDMDGDKGAGVPMATNAIRVAQESMAEISKAAGAGAKIQTYLYGVTVDRVSFGKLIGALDISDCTDGVRVLSGSVINMTGVVGTGHSGHGAVIRGQSQAYIDRDNTTITGTSGNVRLGNAASGVTHLWGDVAAGDALMDGGGKVGAVAGIAEWGAIMDRSSE